MGEPVTRERLLRVFNQLALPKWVAILGPELYVEITDIRLALSPTTITEEWSVAPPKAGEGRVMPSSSWPPRITFTLEGVIAVWARARDLSCTKEDVDALAEVIRSGISEPSLTEPLADATTVPQGEDGR